MKVIVTTSEVQALLFSQLFTSLGVSYNFSYIHMSGKYTYELISVCNSPIEEDEDLLSAINAIMAIANYD